MKALEDRFWEKVRKTDACWLWGACKDRDGYGWIKAKGRMYKAHRVSWEIRNGPISDGLCVLHRCDNPPCVNPDHLFLGTVGDNNRDAVVKNRHRPFRGGVAGEANGRARLTAEQVISIRARKGASQRDLAEEYGVGRTSISDICLGKRWAHIREVYTNAA